MRDPTSDPDCLDVIDTYRPNTRRRSGPWLRPRLLHQPCAARLLQKLSKPLQLVDLRRASFSVPHDTKAPPPLHPQQQKPLYLLHLTGRGQKTKRSCGSFPQCSTTVRQCWVLTNSRTPELQRAIAVLRRGLRTAETDAGTSCQQHGQSKGCYSNFITAEFERTAQL